MDQNSFDLILIFPILLLSIIMCMTSVNIFMFIRKKFPIKVNCWFCNQWTKVPYNMQNSFECPSCLQYNGFTAIGDYNKSLPAQYDISLNKSFGKQEKNEATYSTSNGLCRLCNNNQKLRVFQLANFIPLREADYDIEIEHFQQQLDKAYRLCRQCENTVKKTIQKQNSILGINVRKFTSKGLSMMDLTQNTDGVSVEAKKTFLKNFVFYAILSLLLLDIVYFFRQYQPHILDKFVLVPLSPIILKVQNMSFTFFNRNASEPHLQNVESVFTIWKYPFITDVLFIFELMWKHFLDILGLFTLPLFFNKILTHTQFCLYFVEMLLQFIWLTLNYPKNFKKNSFLLCVPFVVLSLEMSHVLPISLYVDAVKATASTLNITLMCIFSKYESKETKKIFRSSKLRKRNICVNSPSPAKKEFTAEVKPSTFNRFVTKLPFDTQNAFRDIPTATTKDRFSQSFGENLFSNNVDLDISLNKLHIGTAAPKKSPRKISYITSSPNLDRPRPVLSPAKLHVATPKSTISGDFSRDTNKLLTNFTNNQKIREVTDFSQSGHYNINSSHNNFCDDLDYNTFFSPPMCNISAQPQTFRNNFRPYYPRYSCAHHYNSNYQPVINNEQLVYISPNYLPSRDVFEILRENFSTEIFNGSFSETGINKQIMPNDAGLLYNQLNKKFQ